MARTDDMMPELHGMFRDVLRDERGVVTWDSGWQKNAIVTDCRRLLAGFLHGGSTSALGIQGLRVGAGLETWDNPPGPPASTPAQTALVDNNSHLIPRAQLKVDYLAGGTEVSTPTSTLQIVASLGPGVPPWPDLNHTTITLREFGLEATLNGAPVLLNYRTHLAIVKSPVSTLDRTIWLVF
jgi:hypothetical protein